MYRNKRKDRQGLNIIYKYIYTFEKGVCMCVTVVALKTTKINKSKNDKSNNKNKIELLEIR